MNDYHQGQVSNNKNMVNLPGTMTSSKMGLSDNFRNMPCPRRLYLGQNFG